VPLADELVFFAAPAPGACAAFACIYLPCRPLPQTFPRPRCCGCRWPWRWWYPGFRSCWAR